MNRSEKDVPPALSQLGGQRISAVVFLVGYVQVRLERAVVSIINPARIQCGDVDSSSGEAGFARALVGLLGYRLSGASVIPDEELTISLERGARISISLRPSDYRWGPEAVIVDGERAWNVY